MFNIRRRDRMEERAKAVLRFKPPKAMSSHSYHYEDEYVKLNKGCWWLLVKMVIVAAIVVFIVCKLLPK